MNLLARSLRRSVVVPLLAVLATPVFAQPEYAFEQLPEPTGATASEPLAIAITDFNFETPKLTLSGRVRDESGVWHAVVWTQQGSGSWTFELLPVSDPSVDSVANYIACYRESELDFICRVAGSVGTGATEVPASWACTSDSCTWTAQTVVLPAGATGGTQRYNSRIFQQAGGTPEWVSGGSITISDPLGLIRKACVWEWDGSAWQPTVLPGLGAGPAAEYESLGHMEEISFGVARDDDGNDKPVAWRCDSSVDDCTLTGSWSITELPLPSGATQGAINDGDIDADGTFHLIGWAQIIGGGGVPATVAFHEVCNGADDDCDLPASWTATDLGVLPGLVNSSAIEMDKWRAPSSALAGMQNSKARGIGTVYAVAGSSDDGAGNKVATLWEVDTSLSPPVVTIHDLNNLVSNLPSNVTLTEVFAITGRGTVATGKIETSPVSAAASVSGSHAFFLATIEPAIPAVSEWGLVVMSLLVLAAGTLIMVRYRAATRRN